MLCPYGKSRDGGAPDTMAGKIFYSGGKRIIQVGLKYAF